MPDSFATWAAWLAGQLQAPAGQTVTYSRDGDSVELTAIASGSEFGVVDVEAFHLRVRMQDFIVEAEDLVLDSVTVTPQRGDRITRTVGEQTQRFEVLPPSEDMQVYDNPDSRGVIYVIHTKLIAVA